MEVLKARNGRLAQDTWVTGEIIAKKVSEYNSIKMETSMKACGLLIEDMGKELIGEMKRES